MKIVDNLLSTADKIDHGVLTFKTTQEDKNNLKHILSKGFNSGKEPNFSHWIYKNRAGIDHIIIWTKFDLGNLREEALFVTDYDYNIVDIDPLNIDILDQNGEVTNPTNEVDTSMKTIEEEISF